ncbi:bifunctional diguanylate cyclase/phosphodiesterase [Cognatilysobacter tabacisoli]|uniref:bifunctional diguanylate cyclase/phosphodiesterase n=1 Tax=Cognatilysobacter tabacisoli TaxID=2315424 RepID=UPI0018C8ABBC|nr:EAL domain-containing protein [Lysobacter tabacisoli]
MATSGAGDAPAGRGSLAAALQEALPSGSQVAVHWQWPSGELGESRSEHAPPALSEHAHRLMERNEPAPTGAPRRLQLCWSDDDDGSAVAVVADLPEALSPASRTAWKAMARRLVSAHLVALRAQARAELLERSQRLQQALYEIADLAGSDLEMAEMLRRIHEVVGRLMFAENFYIVLYDDVRDSLRFLYFADSQDSYVADPDAHIAIADMPNSLTVGLLRHGDPMRGPSRSLRMQLGIRRDDAHGPDSADWLGVPMRREDRVCGAIVVQSYVLPGVYRDEERALLAFVAQHILTALDRHQAREELERRVEERTRELQQTNRELQAEIVERQRGERLQRALFRIAELSISAESLERFYQQVHDVVAELLYARNFYIALLSADAAHLEFPYSIDERDAVRATRKLSKGLTEYVIGSGRPLLADRPTIDALAEQGVARSRGSLAHCWLGVPLLRGDVPVGVIAVQSYSPAIAFNARDQELLTFVAHHIGIGLARKQAQESLVAAHAELEQRVDARTQELAEANAQLRAQINERLRAEQKLTHQARHDALTGLPNREQLLESLAAAILAAQADPDRQFAVLFLDLDRFKLVNDSAGHSAGDELLVEAGRRIVSAVRSHDVVARLGGDEFAILIDAIDGQNVAEEAAQRIIEVLGQPCWVAGREVFPSASIGIALWHPRYRKGADLLRDADAAMYRAKAGGRDRCAVFDEAMREEAVRILDLEADLRRAINSDSFVAHYQPIVRLADGMPIGHEALLRWRHERRGLLLPGEFIGLGEDTGLIEEVDWLLYAQVAQRLATVDDGYISINVSPRHFLMADFAERLLNLLDAAGADPHRLRIEITEVALLDDAPRALRILRTLRSHGVLAQLDDFGTGFSALSYLHRFPIECLKIDQSFVAGLVGDTRPESVAVVRAIQALAGTLGIYTIGEGVENEAQRAVLRELGCEHGQGYLFGRPVEDPFALARQAALIR